jgi:hypothetical protein
MADTETPLQLAARLEAAAKAVEPDGWVCERDDDRGWWGETFGRWYYAQTPPRMETPDAAERDFAFLAAASPAAVLRLTAALREAAALLRNPPELVRHAVEQFTDLDGGHDADSCAACRWLARRKALLGE